MSPHKGESKERAERLSAEESWSRDLQEVRREVTNFNDNTEVYGGKMRSGSEELKKDLVR